MCISPIRIRNPNKGLKGSFAQFKDTTSEFISVPCGVCYECVQARQLQMVQRLQCEALVNHLFFCTLTYSNKMMPKVTTSTGFDIRYADVKDVQNMMKHIRRYNLFGVPFRYLGVSELGSTRGRPHFHILFLVKKNEDDDLNYCNTLQETMFNVVKDCWSRNVGSKKFPKYVPCCEYVRKYVYGRLRTNFDLHYVDPRLSSGGESDVGFYIMKYMLKPSDRENRLQQALKLNLPDDEYNDIWKLVRTRHFESEGFGLGTSLYKSLDSGKRIYQIPEKVLNHLRKGIDLSKKMSSEPIPSFYSPIDGSSRPLAKYYKSREEIFTMQDYLDL